MREISTLISYVQRSLSAVALLLLAGAAGCQQKEQGPPPKIDTERSHQTKKEATVVVPDTVKGAWKAVKIAVVDKANVKETIYTIPIGSTVSLPGSSMKIEVEAFLPAFVMEGSVMTSSSNDLKNPGAKVKITEKGNIIFNGWLFSRFPTTHAFMHPNYGFTLVDAVPNR
jgi:hypothetical protein